MKLLITGAAGFVGKRVVAAALQAGHSVRALVRPGRDVSQLAWSDKVEFIEFDLAVGGSLASAFDDIHTVVHLAAGMSCSDEQMLKSTVLGTENLLAEMAKTDTRRLVLVSSFSVYDFEKIGQCLDEQSPLIVPDSAGCDRDTYALAKPQQESHVRACAKQHGWDLCVLRPGFIWGPGNEELACVGFGAGPLFFRVSGDGRLPLTFVDNTADAIMRACEVDAAMGQTFNLVDSQGESPVAYEQAFASWKGHRAFRLPLSYSLGIAIARLARGIQTSLLGGRIKLPGFLIPSRFAARFKSLRYENDCIRTVLGWEPKVSFEEGLQKTFGTADRSTMQVLSTNAFVSAETQ